ncbi:hypothetical protein CGZ91_01105 [Parenemella sanctibonifatiensis]|uniref:DUF3618 domain-containing protein n=2 Tax=Parenemella sanctibonifatiensis TaxID=2016505 RepID=A0A255EMJ6_9ACTN|nr:hypothetical protein CGZ92_06140 [Parenemella sanctibonifatiensis]OYN92768.1 hypothetical protein CGZ91_01105 [Parenemella sanctibonifatiensis]
MAKKSTKPARSREQIEADIAAARARLAANVESLVENVHPKAIVRNSVDEAKGLAQAEFENAKAQFKDEDGLRWDRIGMIGGAVVGVVTFVLALRAIVSRAQKSKAA